MLTDMAMFLHGSVEVHIIHNYCRWQSYRSVRDGDSVDSSQRAAHATQHDLHVSQYVSEPQFGKEGKTFGAMV